MCIFAIEILLSFHYVFAALAEAAKLKTSLITVVKLWVCVALCFARFQDHIKDSLFWTSFRPKANYNNMFNLE